MKVVILILFVASLLLGPSASANTKQVKTGKLQTIKYPTERYFAAELTPDVKLPANTVTVRGFDLFALTKEVQGTLHKPVKLTYCYFRFVDPKKKIAGRT